MTDYIIVDPDTDPCRGCAHDCILQGTECDGPIWPARRIERACRECGEPRTYTHLYTDDGSMGIAEYCSRCAHDLRMLGAKI